MTKRAYNDGLEELALLQQDFQVLKRVKLDQDLTPVDLTCLVANAAPDAPKPLKMVDFISTWDALYSKELKPGTPPR
jgi:hypothetical protein